MATIQLELVTPEAKLLSEAVGMVVLPGIDGDMGVLADHAPTVSTLRAGVVAVHSEMNGAPLQRVFVGGGIAEISGERCIILAEEAVDLANLDKVTATTRMTEAEAAMNAATTDGEKAQAQGELNIAQAQVEALSA